jgi:hypothetical protein
MVSSSFLPIPGPRTGLAATGVLLSVCSGSQFLFRLLLCEPGEIRRASGLGRGGRRAEAGSLRLVVSLLAAAALGLTTAFSSDSLEAGAPQPRHRASVVASVAYAWRA